MINIEKTGVEYDEDSGINMLNVMLISIANSKKVLNKKQLESFNNEAKEAIYVQCKRVIHKLNLTTSQYEIILQLIFAALEV